MPSHQIKQQNRYTTKAPKLVLAWDITYLPAIVIDRLYYLYLIEDIYSRKIVGYEVYEQVSSEKASQFLQRAHARAML